MTQKENDRVFDILFNEDEVTWQSIIYDLVKSNEIDPWDVDVILLSKKYMGMLEKLKEMDFMISGKVLLAAAILLKIKSKRLMGADITNFDAIFEKPDDEQMLEEWFDEGSLEQELDRLEGEGKPELIPRTPQPRERNVTIFDLVDALSQALEVKKRRVVRNLPEDVSTEAPAKTRDITEVIREVYGKVKQHFMTNKSILSFEDLTPSNEKEDRIFTFVPLLHLDNQRKVEMVQHQHFSEIFVKMPKKK